jgi:hypothetical protein
MCVTQAANKVAQEVAQEEGGGRAAKEFLEAVERNYTKNTVERFKANMQMKKEWTEKDRVRLANYITHLFTASEFSNAQFGNVEVPNDFGLVFEGRFLNDCALSACRVLVRELVTETPKYQQLITAVSYHAARVLVRFSVNLFLCSDGGS